MKRGMEIILCGGWSSVHGKEDGNDPVKMMELSSWGGCWK